MYIYIIFICVIYYSMCVTQKYTTEESADAWLDGTHEHQIGLSYDSDYTSGNIAGVLQYAFQA